MVQECVTPMLKLARMRSLGMYGTQSSECREHRTRNSECLELRGHDSESLELGMYGTPKVWDSECMELRTRTVWNSEVWNSECMEIRTRNVSDSKGMELKMYGAQKIGTLNVFA